MEEEFWKEGGFAKQITKEDMEKRMETFRMGHDEDVNYDCKECGQKISAHNRDWHDCLCDSCFDEKFYGGE